MSRTASMPLDARDEKCCALPAKRIVGGQIAHSVAVSERHARPGSGTMLATSAVCPWLSLKAMREANNVNKYVDWQLHLHALRLRRRSRFVSQRTVLAKLLGLPQPDGLAPAASVCDGTMRFMAATDLAGIDLPAGAITDRRTRT
jgi:hypothetical protein